MKTDTMPREKITHSEEETLELARRFSENLGPGDVVCLEGELGAGKTRFVKGMAQHFGIDPADVQSPTFTLINEYNGRIPLYHFDCYRMNRLEEALEIGAEEYFYGEGVSVIEWPKLIASIIPEGAHWIEITAIGPSERKITFDNKQN